MNAHLLAAFCVAVTVLMLIPGPNVALITATSMAHGPRAGLFTVAGTASAMAVQLAVTALGLAALLGAAAPVFAWVRYAGAAYLVWLGVQHWRAARVELVPVPRPKRGLFWRGLVVSLTNPKTLFFYAAFFPQFIGPGAGFGPRMALLAALFLGIALVVDSCWVLAAHFARVRLHRHQVLRARLTGSVLAGTGLGLAFWRGR